MHDPLVSGFFLDSVLPSLYTSMKAFRTQWEDSRRARHIAGDPVYSAISSMKCVPRVDAVAQRTGRMTGRQPCSPATKKPAISGQQRLQSVLCSLDSVDNSISPPRRDIVRSSLLDQAHLSRPGSHQPGVYARPKTESIPNSLCRTVFRCRAMNVLCQGSWTRLHPELQGSPSVSPGSLLA